MAVFFEFATLVRGISGTKNERRRGGWSPFGRRIWLGNAAKLLGSGGGASFRTTAANC